MASRTVEMKESGGMGTLMIRGEDSREPEVLAEMVFEWDDGVMEILHTAIRPGYEEQDLSRLLVEYARKRATRDGFALRYTCPFAAKVAEEIEDG